MHVCVIDIGSNTVKSAIYEVENGLECIIRKTVHTSLLSYIEDSKLSEMGFSVLKNAVSELSSHAQNLGCTSVFAFATAAMRMCRNSKEVIRRIKKDTGVSIDLISGEKEALLTFQSAVESTENMKNEGICIDLGGGSCEIISFDNGNMKSSVSLTLGSLFLYEKFVSNILPTKEEYQNTKTYVSDILDSSANLPKTENVYLIGGTARAALKVLYGKRAEISLPYVVKAMDLEGFLEKVLRLEKSAKLDIIGSVPERAHTICTGIALFLTVADKTGAKEFVVTDASVRDGYLKERIKDL